MCRKGHTIDENNRVAHAQAWRCRICAEERRRAEFSAQADADWVIIERMIQGRWPGRSPTHLEVLVARRALSWRTSNLGPLHHRLGIEEWRLASAESWRRDHNVAVPTPSEVYWQEIHGDPR